VFTYQLSAYRKYKQLPQRERVCALSAVVWPILRIVENLMPMLEIQSATKDYYRATFCFLLSTFCTPNFMAEKVKYSKSRPFLSSDISIIFILI
jgi:hypothetical protein